MLRARYILSAARVTTVWLLMVVSMFLGPVSVFAAGPDACGDACPCDEAEHDDHDEDDGGDEESADGFGHGTPADEECPEDCPGCHASSGVALASFACSLPTSLLSSSTHDLIPSDAAATGVDTGVFRPPRSLNRTR